MEESNNSKRKELREKIKNLERGKNFTLIYFKLRQELRELND